MDWPAEQIVRKKTQDIVPYNRNPRLHSEEQIRQIIESIKQWGWTIPLVVDESDNLIAGHGRLEAAQEMGVEEVPCVIAKGWSEAQKKAYVIADNKLAENGYWDTGLYYSELKALADEGFDINLTGVELDITQLSFVPNLEPITSYEDVTDEDVIKANNNIDEAFDKAGRDASFKGQEVICPHCAKTFRFEGM